MKISMTSPGRISRVVVVHARCCSVVYMDDYCNTAVATYRLLDTLKNVPDMDVIIGLKCSSCE